ncbi:hypothetical protein Tco_1107051 [Tanacetum coccineum]
MVWWLPNAPLVLLSNLTHPCGDSARSKRTRGAVLKTNRTLWDDNGVKVVEEMVVRDVMRVAVGRRWGSGDGAAMVGRHDGGGLVVKVMP